MERVRVVIDHVAGARRGQRQEFAANQRVRFGRHPDCEVSFDPNKDIDASSRHAELRVLERPPAAEESAEPGWVLVDLGSSNGTYVDGRRVTEAPVGKNAAIAIEFGPGGPRVRLFVGDEAAIERLPPPPVERARPPWLAPAAIGGILALVVIVMALVKC
jgi:pSer/pThr/pTyr-binding forkhead associated (FHA) protein